MAKIPMESLDGPKSVSTMFSVQLDTRSPAVWRCSQHGLIPNDEVRQLRLHDCSCQSRCEARLVVFHVGGAGSQTWCTAFKATVLMIMLT